MRKLGKFWLVFLALAALLLALAVACEEEEEQEILTATPTATVTGTPTPAGGVEGITDTEIILGQHGPRSGTWGAAYAPVIGGVEAYFKYVNAEEGGACDRQIVLKVEDDQYLPSGAVEAVKKLLERPAGIEPALSPWKGDVPPQHFGRSLPQPASRFHSAVVP